MFSTSSKSAYWEGFLASLPFLLVVAPFGGVFGVVGTEAGLNLAEVMGFSILVIAGAAQFTALQLMTENAPTLVILASALAVNLRMAMYSASLVPHLNGAPLWQRALVSYLVFDQNYALSVQEYETRPERPTAVKIAFFFGTATAVAPVWILSTYLGAVIGALIPPAFALDFAVPIAFLALIGPALRTIAHVAAALSSVALSIAFAPVPYNLGLILAAAIAMMIGAEIERRMEARS
ncbi:branched-chain amino acid ABC transporter permease [Roseobacter sp. HKCCD9010]|uniref:AzlC family ABC transporter permease n=1 Tax=unclassified Roseobacter TaxID=196798 RepID=UPI0014926C80|nr:MULTISPECIES: AzlC family ABC transporter permease [unclassified Roseobacter]MBF9050913.1 branched-chain amino acid ABC transporter permease [Rhodobacterales bacterium HKCCD4356]NNV12682.1 branched-chain amino acid ABC transporter permease [Roseobacter sp. HKCCD7357]NNV16626.1 branched-chain amino acid ABC transporter permease [Roseobacter sp. HKCCD8768]NNV26742.1 branched-chain amino acid ABC transporter permease [Roseobacter sp. HKCCD8192]NNV30345.1 branched-chain amino acid ABC transport